MKVGVIGAGNWGKNLIKNFLELGVLSGIADPVEENRAKARETAPHVEVFASGAELLSSDCDAIAIATPAPTHFELAAAGLRAGKDVFVEKPMTLTSAESEELVELADAHDRILMVGHLLLFQPPIQFIKKFLDEGKLGEIYHLHQERKKLGRARYIENVTWSLGVHDIAVLLYLVGKKPRFVFASGHCGLQKEVEDDVYVHMEFLGGTKAHLHNSWLWPDNRRQLTIIGEHGMLVYDEIASRVVWHRKHINENLDSVDEGSEVVFEGNDPPLIRELSHFIECVKTRTRPIADGRNACVAACYAENNVPVMGADAMRRGRTMSWLRIERFVERSSAAAPRRQVDNRFLPMLCQHCDTPRARRSARCLRRTHRGGAERSGLHRCVGTRYCANNCPYKVRRFNWSDQAFPSRSTAAQPRIALRVRDAWPA